jgi:leucyl-tRNA synthetase
MADTAPDVEQLFVSYELTDKYSPECFSRLYVDIALVNDDVLNLEEARRRPMFQKARFKIGPEGRFRCAYEIEKMSKSKYNAIVPDGVIEQYGADCFRMYEMFLGPIEASKPWDTKGINGVQGFLKRFWSLFFDANGSWLVKEEPPSRSEWRALHTAIKKITEDIERFSLNTCVSQLMILTNELRALKCHKRDILEPALVLLAPFAPHLAEELWHRLGHQTTICDANWPIWEEQYLETDKVIYPVQINGKHRGNIEVDASAPLQAIEALALQQDFVQRSLGNGQVKKVIVVPGRIVNIVV